MSAWTFPRHTICAFGSMVVGLVIWVQITSFEFSFMNAIMTIWTAIGAATGGYFCAKLFGRKNDQLWKSVLLVILGAFLATLIGATIGGTGLGVLLLFADGARASLISIVFGPIVVFGVIFFGGKLLPLITWVVGFSLLEVVVRKYASDLSEDVPRP